MAIRRNPLVQKMMEIGEAQLDRLTTQILGNEKFVSAVQGIVSRSLSAKGTLDRSIRAALATMSLPSVKDIDDLRGRLDELDRSIGEIAAKLEKVEKGMGAQKAASKTVSPSASKTSKTTAQGRAKGKNAGGKSAAKASKSTKSS